MEEQFLKSCDNTIVAQEIVDHLSEIGIECRVVDVSISSNMINCNGGINTNCELYVHTDNYERALEIVKSLEKKRNESICWCPECGSENITNIIIHHKHAPKWQIITTLILCAIIIASWFGLMGSEKILVPGGGLIIFIATLFIPYNVKKFHCKDCGADFKRVE